MKIYQVVEPWEHPPLRTFSNREAAEEFARRYTENREIEVDIEEYESLDESPTWTEQYRAWYRVYIPVRWDHATQSMATEREVSRGVDKRGHWSDEPPGAGVRVYRVKGFPYIVAAADTEAEAISLREAAVAELQGEGEC